MSSGTAAGLELEDPRAAGLDPLRLDHAAQFLRREYLDKGLLPHAQLLVAREGHPVFLSTQGQANSATREMLPEDAIFRIASMTKPVTSLAFMKLVEDGRVLLDTPVGEWIPELASVQVFEGEGEGEGKGGAFRTKPLDRPMMMVDLLRHTSGLTYDFQNRSPVDAAYRERGLVAIGSKLSLEEFAAALGELPLLFSPGTAWNYGVSTDVLALAVQRIAGMPFERFVAEQIFAPLGMIDTGFHVPQDKLHRLPEAWALDEQGRPFVFDAAGGESAYARQPVLISGGGGLASTIADWHRFCRMLLGGGSVEGTRIVSPATIRMMTSNHLPGGGDLASLSRSMFSEAIYAGQGYGLGFGVNVDPALALTFGSPGDFYWGGIYSTYFMIDPIERLSMIFMTQLAPSTAYPLRRQLRSILYSALLPRC